MENQNLLSKQSSPQELESWKIPLTVVFCLHLGLAIAVTFAPQFAQKKPRFENVYTIDLVEIPSLPQAPPPPPAPTPTPKLEVKTPPKKAISIAKEPAPVVEAPEAAPISIAPDRTKKKKIVEEPKPEAPKKPDIDRDKMAAERKKLAELIREQNAAEEEERAAREALEEERRLMAEAEKSIDNAFNRPTQSANPGSNTNNGGGSQNAIEARWFAAVRSHMLANWELPDIKPWDPNTLAVVVIRVDKNGKVLESYIEQSSGDHVFDQFAQKSVQEAGSLPPMPAAMKRNQIEFGLKYQPGSIF